MCVLLRYCTLQCLLCVGIVCGIPRPLPVSRNNVVDFWTTVCLMGGLCAVLFVCQKIHSECIVRFSCRCSLVNDWMCRGLRQTTNERCPHDVMLLTIAIQSIAIFSEYGWLLLTILPGTITHHCVWMRRLSIILSCRVQFIWWFDVKAANVP